MEDATNKGFGHNHFPQPQHRHRYDQQIHHQGLSPDMMMMPSLSSSAASSSTQPNFMARDSGGGGGGGGGGGAYEFGELDQAFFLYLDDQGTTSSMHHDQKQSISGTRSTLDMFPSQPMHVDPSKQAAIEASKGVVPKSESGAPSMALGKDMNDDPTKGPPHQPPSKVIKRESHRKGTGTGTVDEERSKTLDAKVLRRLAQNREAARKSRLRKKAYVQQLESSRVRLSQLEQELQRARSQGVFFSGGGGGDQNGVFGSTIASEAAAVFDMQYARWMEEHHRRICELRSAAEDHGLTEDDLRPYVDNCVAHYEEEMNLRRVLAKSDVFYLMSGMWTSPAERCFLWIAGFRPSRLVKIAVNQLEPMTEQQLMGIYGLQQSTQEAEESLSRGLEGLNRSLSDTIASDSLLESPTNVAEFMGHMALAINKLSTLEALVSQADSLRHQTIHRLHQLLTTQQVARSVLAVAEYSHRLRALSSLWLSRP